MMTDQQADDALRALMRESVTLSSDGVSDVLAALPRTRQQRGWLSRRSHWRFSMLSATKYVAAGVIMALFAGVLFAGALRPTDESLPAIQATASAEVDTDESEPTLEADVAEGWVDAPARPIRLPTAIPDGFERGSLDSAIGKVRWAKVTSARNAEPNLRHMSGLIATSDGYLYDDWYSPDLLEWSRVELADGWWPSQTFEWAGSAWMVARPEGTEGWQPVPQTLWRSEDGRDWQQMDTGGLFRPGPPDVDWEAWFGSPVSVGEVEAIPVRLEARWLADQLGIVVPDCEDYCAWGIQARDDGLYRVVGGYGEDRGSVSFEPMPGGVRVLDETGETVTELDGWSVEFIDRWTDLADAVPDGQIVPVEHRIALLVDGRIDWVELPDASPLAPRGSLTLFEIPSGLMAILPEAEETARTWVSTNGLDWASGEIIGDDDDEPSAIGYVREEGGVIAAYSEREEGGPTRWISTDGSSWEQRARDPHHTDNPWGKGREDDPWKFRTRLGSGDLVQRRKGSLVFVPNGGKKAIPLELGEIGKLYRVVGARPISEDTIVIAKGGKEHDVWIVTFDGLSE